MKFLSPSLNKLPENPRKLLLLSEDRSEEPLLRKYLEADQALNYQLFHYSDLEQLKFIDLETFCHAALVDLRNGYTGAQAAIEWIESLRSPVALICLCDDHKQLLNYDSVAHLIDDYILFDNLKQEELTTRIGQAIRRHGKKRQLLHEQDLLHSLLHNVPDAIYFKDRQCKFTKVSKAMAHDYGYEPKNIIGKSDFDLFTEEHARPTYNDEQEIIRTGEPIIGKLEKETFEDGSVNWVTSTKIALRDAHKRIIGTMGISRNVTDLKNTQDKLAEEHQLLQTILNNLPDRIFVKDREGRYILSNKHHMRFLGVEKEKEVIGTTLYDHLPKEYADKPFKEDLEIMRRGIGLINTEEKIENPDGTTTWYLTSKVPLLDESQQCFGVVGISRDVSIQKENEKKLRETIQVLNETQLQLIEAEKLKTVGRLAAGVAHEVKNPLNVVTLGAEYLENKITEPAELAEIVRDMKQAIEKANSVIFELLDYSSPHDVRMVPMDVNELINQVVALLRHNFSKAGIEVRKELDSKLPDIQGDAAKLEQVFVNLFLNAINAMRKGGILEIRTYSERMKNAGSNVSSQMSELFRVGDKIVIIEVADTGTGIDNKTAEKLFDPFFSTKSTGEGTGLGLSVARSIVDMHRGAISLGNRGDVKGARATINFQAVSNENV
ncbi:MAG: PAS domain-containing protein [Verrucomicrobiota bacterium]